MAEGGYPSSKISKLSNAIDKNWKESISQTIFFLETSQIASLVLLTIKNCDAEFNTSFSDATCHVQESVRETAPPHAVYGFTSIFQHGVNILKAYLSDENSLPEGKGSRLAIERLMTCLHTLEKNGGKLSAGNGKLSGKKKRENNWTVQVAHHLLKELAVDQSYIIDSYSGNQTDRCPCCSETLTGRYGDTSIGNENVWHGSMNILMEQSVAVRVEEATEETSTRGNTSSVEIQDDSAYKDKRHRNIAETIVFAFLQKKAHPHYENFLIPTIGISKQDVVVHLYDPERDILLESGPIELFQLGNTKISFTAIVTLWLAINYQYFCTGITPSMESSTANLFKMINKDAQEIYENCLQFGSCHTGAADEKSVRYRTDCIVKIERPLKWSNPAEK